MAQGIFTVTLPHTGTYTCTSRGMDWAIANYLPCSVADMRKVLGELSSGSLTPDLRKDAASLEDVSTGLVVLAHWWEPEGNWRP